MMPRFHLAQVNIGRLRAPIDYVSQQLTLLALKKRLGIEIDIGQDLPEGIVDPQSIPGLARHPRCRFVAVCWMPTNSGLCRTFGLSATFAHNCGSRFCWMRARPSAKYL